MSAFSENVVWSPEDIVNNASNWSLAADKDLLRHLHVLSEKILLNASKTNDNLVGLLDDLDRTGLRLDLANIELESLHHTQFIESRVYEDDDEFETSESRDVEVKIDKKAEEETAQREIEEGLLEAIKAVEEYYDYKEMPNCDSDDETDSPNFVWQPKDPYLARPLPYVIGTSQWYRKWHVGLLDDDSSDEDIKIAKTVKDDIDSQSSDDDRYLPPINRRPTIPLDTDSGTNQWRPSDIIDIDSKTDSNPIANSTVVAGIDQYNEESTSLPIKEPNASFAEQLAKKLGNVAQAQESAAKLPETNARPIRKPQTNVNLFFDEPPPLCPDDDSESSDNDGIFGKPGKSTVGLFGRSNVDLFDDDEVVDENETFWGRSAVKKQNKDVEAVEKSNIFDDDAVDDLFAPKPANKMATSKYITTRTRTVLPLFDDEPPELPQEIKKKKPIGGVSIFGNTDIMKTDALIKNLRRPSLIDSRESTPELDVASSINKAQEPEKVGIISKTSVEKIENKAPPISTNEVLTENKTANPEQMNLFDENDPFEGDLFSSVGSKKFTSSLFNDFDSPEENERPSLFYASNVNTVKNNDEKTNLFNKDSIINNNNNKKPNLVENLPVNTNILTTDSSRTAKSDISVKTNLLDESSKNASIKTEISLFDDEPVNFYNHSKLVDDQTVNKSDIDIIKPAPNKRTALFENNSNIVPKPAKRRNLFDDDNEPPTVLSNAQNTSHNRRKPNLFEDFDEPADLFSQITSDSDEVVNIDNNNKDEAKNVDKKVEIQSKDDILSISDQKLASSENVSKFVENSVNEPELPVTEEMATDLPVKDDLSKTNLTYLPLFDTPPDINDDCDCDSESESDLFNDENHLLYDDDSNDSSIPVIKSSIFDVEPPLFIEDNVKKETTSKNEPVEVATEHIDNSESISTNISIADHFSTPQSNRRNISIHERLNSISETPILDKNMAEKNVGNVEVIIDQVQKEEEKFLDAPKLIKEPINIETLDNSPRKIGPPGKIKYNININVAALLPGASKKPEGPKNTKTEVENTADILKNTLDELDGTTEILQCITKDRAKIPVKRRPSTRKSRLEHTPKTQPENVANNEITSSDNNNKKCLPSGVIIKNTSATPKPPINQNIDSNKLKGEGEIFTGAIKKSSTKKQSCLFAASSDSSDSDDIFKPKKSPAKNKNAINPAAAKTARESADIFNGLNLKSQSLFDKQPVIKGDVFESPDYKKSKIFFDDENVEDYFSSKKLPPKSNFMKKSLFDDEEDGDDLFQSNLFKDDMKPAKIGAPQLKRSTKTTKPLFAGSDAKDDPLNLFK